MTARILYREILRQGNTLENRIPPKGIQLISDKIQKNVLRKKVPERSYWKDICKANFVNFRVSISCQLTNRERLT